MAEVNQALSGRNVLLVEDEYFIVDDIRRAFQSEGAHILGPAGRVVDALDLIAEAPRIDGAVLDINLQGDMVFPVADALMERGVPFVFTTGYEQPVIPQRYEGVKRCEKPIDPGRIARALFG